MRQIDADAYASEMKKRQDACMDAMADAHSDRMYTENEHWAGVLAAFAEAKITLDKMPTVGGWVSVKDRLPEFEGDYLVTDGHRVPWICRMIKLGETKGWVNNVLNPVVKYWMPIPEPPKEENWNGRP